MVQLFDLPHAEARRLVATGAPVYLSVNPVEFHGPHLSLHNDRLVSGGLIVDLHRRLQRRHPDWPLLLAADLEVGVEPTWGVGSRHTSFAVTSEVVREACRALAELGARRVVLMTFHGGPLHNLAIDDGTRLLESRGVRAVAPLNLVLQELLRVDGSRFAPAFAHVEDPDERAEMMRSLRLDFHAGFFETSLSLHYVPESVDPGYRELPPCPAFGGEGPLVEAAKLARAVGRDALADEFALGAVGFGWHRLKPFPGYTGRPHRATAAAGALFAQYIGDAFEPVVEAVLDGRARSPAPIMRWVRYASLGGRVGGFKISPYQMAGIDGAV
jgi:creatinine amidohydrolase